MNIVYDHQAFSMQQYGGISRYFYEIATRISRYADVNITLFALIHLNQYLRSSSFTKVVGLYCPPILKTARLRKSFNNLIGKALIKNYKPDIIHETYYQKDPIRTKKVKTVITIYDMIHDLFPEKFSIHDNLRELKKIAIKRADKIICISKTTRNDLLKIYKIDPANISVVYLGPSFALNTYADKYPIIAVPYVLYVGSRNGYKNFQNLLEGYANSSRLKSDLHLVCFGGGRLKPAELTKMRALKLDLSKVIQISGNDAQLSNLYKNARAFICPSLYEGFGLSSLEAMALGCPVVCSNTGSLPEVVGEGAEFFNPYDIEHIAHSLEKVVYSDTRSSELVRLGLKIAKKFSWKHCAMKTYEIYKSLL